MSSLAYPSQLRPYISPGHATNVMAPTRRGSNQTHAARLLIDQLSCRAGRTISVIAIEQITSRATSGRANTWTGYPRRLSQKVGIVTMAKPVAGAKRIRTAGGQSGTRAAKGP